MAVSLERFTSFFQDEGKHIQYGENDFKHGLLESGNYAEREIVNRVRASMWD